MAPAHGALRGYTRLAKCAPASLLAAASQTRLLGLEMELYFCHKFAQAFLKTLPHIYFPESLHLPGFSCLSSVSLVLLNHQSFLALAWPVICLSRNVKLRNFGLQLYMMCGSQNSCWRWELKRHFLGTWTWTTRKSDVRRWKSKDLMDFHHINI